jgi:CheY-like chemotaxis protein
MSLRNRTVVILMADDDPEDREFARDALSAARVANDFREVHDGEELIDYLKRRGDYADPVSSPRPGLILLDLKMPRRNGFEALEEIRADPELRGIPVVILTTSGADEDVVRGYRLGVNSYIRKPVTFDGLVEAMSGLGRYWFEIVELPPDEGGGGEEV